MFERSAVDPPFRSPPLPPSFNLFRLARHHRRRRLLDVKLGFPVASSSTYLPSSFFHTCTFVIIFLGCMLDSHILREFFINESALCMQNLIYNAAIETIIYIFQFLYYYSSKFSFSTQFLIEQILININKININNKF